MSITDIFEARKYGSLGVPLEQRSQQFDALIESLRSGATQPASVRTLGGSMATNPTVFTCINTIAQKCAEVPLVLLEDGKVVEDHWISALLERPNPHMTQNEWVYSIVSHLLSSGGAPQEVVFEGALPLEIWPVLPERLLRIKPETGLGLTYEFRVGRRTILADQTQVIYFKSFNPNDDFFGLTPLQSLENHLQADAFAIEYNKLFFENSAMPGGIIKVDSTITPKTGKKVADLWAQQHRGRQKAHNVAVLGKGSDFKSISLSQKDMEFVQLLEHNGVQIQKVFRVPEILLGASKNSNRSIAREEMQSFYMNVVVPILRYIEKRLTKDLVEIYEPESRSLKVRFNVDQMDAMLDNMLVKGNVAKNLLMGGWTPNQVLTQFWGLPESDDPAADMIFIPANMIPIGMALANNSVLGGNAEAPVTPADRSAMKTMMARMQEIIDQQDKHPLEETNNPLDKPD